MSEIEYFYSAHSAFAYLGSAFFMEIAERTGRRIVHKPINLTKVMAAAHSADFKDRSRPHVNYYFNREIERWAEYRGVPFKGGVPASHRNDTSLVNCMLIAADLQGQNIDRLAHALLEAHWRDHADLANEATLRDIAGSVGLGGEALLAEAGSEAVKSAYEANNLEAIERSVFGSPTYFIDGDMFYGQDHLEFVERAHNKPFARTWPAR